MLPGTLMSHAVLDSEHPVKAMIVLAGNPLLSIGGEERMRKAFEQMELVVCIDIYRNATGELAHWVLPATDQYEREDLNIVNIGTSHRPFAQFTTAVVEPAAERRPEWWIVQALLQAMGRLEARNLVPVAPQYDSKTNFRKLRMAPGWVLWEEPIGIIDHLLTIAPAAAPADRPVEKTIPPGLQPPPTVVTSRK